MNKEILYEENCYLRKREAKLYKALLDIKEYIEKDQKKTSFYRTIGLETGEKLLDIVNKALGDKENESR